MADSPNENASEWEQIGDPTSLNPIEQRKQSLRQTHGEGSNNSPYAIAGGMALLVLAFAIWAITSPPQAPVKPTRTGQTGRTVDEQIAYGVGQTLGVIAGIWGGTLLCAALLRSTRRGPRESHPNPGRFAMFFGYSAVSSLGGAVLLWMGTDPRTDTAPGAMRVVGALTLILGAVLFAWAVTKPVVTTARIRLSLTRRVGAKGATTSAVERSGDLESPDLVEPQPAPPWKGEAHNGWRYATAAVLGVLVLALAVWTTTSMPQPEVNLQRVGPQERVGEEQMAFGLGQTLGVVAGLWLGSLLSVLLLRSTRRGPRADRPAPVRFALWFVPAVALSLGGVVLLWMGTIPRAVQAEALRGGGATSLVLGAFFFAFAVTKPVVPTEEQSPGQ